MCEINSISGVFIIFVNSLPERASHCHSLNSFAKNIMRSLREDSQQYVGLTNSRKALVQRLARSPCNCKVKCSTPPFCSAA